MDRRAELKQEYKNKPKNMGVYQIRNKVNGKIFLGSSLNLDGMLNRFNMGVKFDNFSNGNTGLSNEIKTFGMDNFAFEVLDRLKPVEDPLYDYKEDLKALESLWFEQLQPYGERGYHKLK